MTARVGGKRSGARVSKCRGWEVRGVGQEEMNVGYAEARPKRILPPYRGPPHFVRLRILI